MSRTLIALAALMLAAPAFADGVLFAGTDEEDFAEALPDRLGRFTTVGPTVTGGAVIPLDYFLNGMANGPGFLYAGDALSNTLRTIDYDGTLLTSIAAGFPTGCCNEEMLWDGASGLLYHAHFEVVGGGGAIQTINPADGAVVMTFPQDDVVGMAWVGNAIWISKWSAREVGRWDPATNTFTPVFSTALSTPDANTGGLAYDPLSNVLWIGFQGGWVYPYDLAGNVLGAGFQPFGPIGNTVDGLELVVSACPPTPTVTVSPATLWPPNHQMVDVTVSYTLPECAAPATCELSVQSNEPVNDGGDGNTAPDFEVLDPTHVSLRAERAGGGTGRIYSIVVTCTDVLGQTGTATAVVTVPHDQGQ